MKIEKLDCGSETRYSFDCPGCGFMHSVRVSGSSPSWSWNGSFESPTFSPSILATWTSHVPAVTPENLDQWKKEAWPQTEVPSVCHSFVTDGHIQFLGDCTHSLAGQTVELPELDED